jgi:hypothetical protein
MFVVAFCCMSPDLRRFRSLIADPSSLTADALALEPRIHLFKPYPFAATIADVLVADGSQKGIPAPKN